MNWFYFSIVRFLAISPTKIPTFAPTQIPTSAPTSLRNYTTTLKIGPLKGDRTFSRVWFQIKGDEPDGKLEWTDWFVEPSFNAHNQTYIFSHILTNVGNAIGIRVLKNTNNDIGIVGIGVDSYYLVIDPTVYLAYQADGDGCSFMTVDFETMTIVNNATQYSDENSICPFDDELITLAPLPTYPSRFPTRFPTRMHCLYHLYFVILN